MNAENVTYADSTTVTGGNLKDICPEHDRRGS